MVPNSNSINAPAPQIKYLWFLTLSYCMATLFANWFSPRLIHLFGITQAAGILIFPLTFLLSDLITEVYGYKYARLAIWCGFLFNILFIIYGQIVIHMPSPDFSKNINTAFDTLLALNMRITFASLISYFASEPLNTLVMAKLKIKTQGKYLGLRFISSTFIAAGVDSIIFSSLAFYGTLKSNELVSFILAMWLIKILIEIAGLPISIYATNVLKKIERIDVYDKKTHFNFFSLSTEYKQDENEYGKHN